jgi:SAM-dependent methyltransferase
MNDRRQEVCARLFPEVQAGGFTRLDGTIEFYSRVNALALKDSVVLDYGAGRGRFFEDPVTYRRDLRLLKGNVARVIGVDVDPVVRLNPAVDDAYCIAQDGRIPVKDGTVDLIVSDFTFEHVERPRAVADELTRVLKPGGWIAVRTPNKYGYVALGARLVPVSRMRERSTYGLKGGWGTGPRSGTGAPDCQ